MQTAGDIFDANINCYLELVQDARAGECRTVLNISGAVNSASTHFSGRYNYNGGIQDVSILIYQNITSASNYYYHYKGVNLYQLFCFRPVLEYIDNPNSKTIYF